MLKTGLFILASGIVLSACNPYGTAVDAGPGCTQPCDLALFTPTCDQNMLSSCIVADETCGRAHVVQTTCPMGCSIDGLVCEGMEDAGTDAGVDAGGAGQTDGGDAGVTDGGDAGSADAGSTDGGSTDAGSADAGSPDAGSTDAGSADAGAADAGSTGLACHPTDLSEYAGTCLGQIFSCFAPTGTCTQTTQTVGNTQVTSFAWTDQSSVSESSGPDTPFTCVVDGNGGQPCVTIGGTGGEACPTGTQAFPIMDSNSAIAATLCWNSGSSGSTVLCANGTTLVLQSMPGEQPTDCLPVAVSTSSCPAQ